MDKQGRYIVIEGHDGTGKSTQVELIRDWLKTEHEIDSIEFHEPAGSPIADEIRTILKNGSLERDGTTNMLLFTAARHDIWETRAKTALKVGKWVVAARSYLSTLAYQGYGEGLDLNLIKQISEISLDQNYLNPDYEFILDLDNENERFDRINQRGELENKDTFESKSDDFQERVRQGYLQIAADRNIPVISANQTPEEISQQIRTMIDLSE
jgi:dTMP kinase